VKRSAFSEGLLYYLVGDKPLDEIGGGGDEGGSRAWHQVSFRSMYITLCLLEGSFSYGCFVSSDPY
jgi:hypothetical protein